MRRVVGDFLLLRSRRALDLLHVGRRVRWWHLLGRRMRRRVVSSGGRLSRLGLMRRVGMLLGMLRMLRVLRVLRVMLVVVLNNAGPLVVLRMLGQRVVGWRWQALLGVGVMLEGGMSAGCSGRGVCK